MLLYKLTLISALRLHKQLDNESSFIYIKNLYLYDLNKWIDLKAFDVFMMLAIANTKFPRL